MQKHSLHRTPYLAKFMVPTNFEDNAERSTHELETLGVNSSILAPSNVVGTGEQAPYLARLGNLLLGGFRLPCCLPQPGSGAAL
jgi:hypothetical protein